MVEALKEAEESFSLYDAISRVWKRNVKKDANLS